MSMVLHWQIKTEYLLSVSLFYVLVVRVEIVVDGVREVSPAIQRDLLACTGCVRGSCRP
jgi:hypothetical protein